MVTPKISKHFVKKTIPHKKNIPDSLIIYTDGSVKKNNQIKSEKGNFSAGIGVFIPKLDVCTCSRLVGKENTLINSDWAETQAVVTALKIAGLYPLDDYTSITVHTDSTNLLNFVQSWEDLYFSKGWTKVKEDISKLSVTYYPGKMLHHKDDLDELFGEIYKFKYDLNGNSTNFAIHWEYVKAHSGEPGNTKCDALAKLGHTVPYDNNQLYESFKLTLEDTLGSLYKQKTDENIKYLVKLLKIPVHITSESILNLNVFKGQAEVIDEKVTCDAIKNVTIRVTQKVVNVLMVHRSVQLNKPITVSAKVYQCEKCLQLGHHLTEKCTKGVRCGHCGQYKHREKGCPLKDVNAVCANCLDYGFHPEHSVYSPQCPLQAGFAWNIGDIGGDKGR